MPHDFSALLSDMTLPMHRALVEHWLELYDQAGRRVPPVQAIDPLKLGRFLPDICILDHEGGSRYRYRLSGGNVDEFYGQPVKDKYMADLIEEPTRTRLLDMAHAILTMPAAVMHGLSSLLPQWNYSVALQRISLPLADRDGALRHIISATVFRYDRSQSSTPVGTDFQHRYRIPQAGDAPVDLRTAG